MSQTLIEHIELLILPPGGNFVLIGLGVLLLKQWRKLAIVIMTLSLIVLYLLSTEFIAGLLTWPLEQVKPLNSEMITHSEAQAIVVLGGAKTYAPEYGGFTVSDGTLARARYAAFLYHKTRLPILTTGFEQAHLLAQTLKTTFDVPTQWQEPNSVNTFENAKFTQKILHAHHIKTFFLVTSVWHMPRALWAFRKEGLNPIPAPTDYRAAYSNYEDLTPWLPNARALSLASRALHEYIGRIWYALRYG